MLLGAFVCPVQFVRFRLPGLGSGFPYQSSISRAAIEMPNGA